MIPYNADTCPLVSVHLLTYNHALFIKEAIESVLAQKTTFKFEIIIGDDCSTDGTSAIVDAYQEKFPEIIKVVRGEKNGGPQPNSIRILNNCSGKYMAALEGDDHWIDPLKLQKQADFMEANPDFAICFTNTQVDFFDEEKPSYLLNDNLEKDIFTIDDLIKEHEVWFMGTATLFYVKQAIFPISPWFPKTKSGDIPMIMLAARHGKIKFLPDVTAVYRRHAKGASNTDYKDDAKFLENRIMMYNNLNKDLKYVYNDRFKKNLASWYYLLINAVQYRKMSIKKLGIILQYYRCTFPSFPNLKIIFKDHILPSGLLRLSQKLRKLFGLL
jgi:glycosyltransferase involved in cell wall biosynthesis